MTDRELLYLAARAAGIERGRWDDEWLRALGHMVLKSWMWNPLENDGDAFRLAVTLNLFADDDVVDDLNIQSVPPSMAGVRRAITRAAAEIGRALAAQDGEG